MYKREILGQFVGLICVPLEKVIQLWVVYSLYSRPKSATP